MEYQNADHFHRLYGCLCEPEEMICWRTLPLKSGVYIVVVLDVLVGSLSCLNFIDVVLYTAHHSGLYIFLKTLELILAVTAVPFAIQGFQGIRNVQQPRLHLYTQFKQVELPLVLVMTVITSLVFCDDDLIKCDPMSVSFALLVRGGFNLYFLHVVWSADQRLQRNETVLVMHGKDVLLLMREQAKVLGPRVFVLAERGQAISQTPIGELVQPISS